MLHDSTKSQKLLGLLTQGLLTHGRRETERHLGDRSQYIGMSDIGKGMECMRSAVASKLGMSATPSSGDVAELAADDLDRILGRQITLQRGHWQEHGIENALVAAGVKLVPQLEIVTEHNGVPIRAHLDFTLVWGGDCPAVRILELKSNARIPDTLYPSYEAQLYGQIGLLWKCWNRSCFSVPTSRGHPIRAVTFPDAVQALFGIELPDDPNLVDVEAWVLSLSMDQARPFGPYVPDEAMLAACMQVADSIWSSVADVRSGKQDLNDLSYCRGFHPLCDWCDVSADCPKYQRVDLAAQDSACEYELKKLAALKEKRKLLGEQITEIEKRIRTTYRLATVNHPGDWVQTSSHRFRVVNVAGRTSLDRGLVQKAFLKLLGDNAEAEIQLKHCEKVGKGVSRLYVGKVSS